MCGVMSGSRGPFSEEGRAATEWEDEKMGKGRRQFVLGLEGAADLRRAGAGDWRVLNHGIVPTVRTIASTGAR